MDATQHLWLWGAIIGLMLTTVITRCFFLLTPQSFEFPEGVQKALSYAPSIAIVAVIAPDLLMQKGVIDISWHNPSVLAALVTILVFVWRKGFLLPLVSGMCVYTGMQWLSI